MRWDEEYGAAFYVEPPDEPEPPDWVPAQAESIGVNRWPEGEVAYGTWNGFAVDVHDVHGYHFRGIALSFSARQFELLRGTKGRGFEDAFVAGFRDACLRVRASAGFVSTLVEPGVEELAAATEGDVTGKDLQALLRRDVELLYLNETWFDDLDLYLPDPRREEIPVEGGRLLVAWPGHHRGEGVSHGHPPARP